VFQAEVGIRDCHVTGVQTCALPIFPAFRRSIRSALAGRDPDESSIMGLEPLILRSSKKGPCPLFLLLSRTDDTNARCTKDRFRRSEERRVGKGGDARSRCV